MAGGDLFPALLYESGLKPSLATTHAKASRRVIATLWADKEKNVWGDSLLLKEGLKPSLATTHAKASRRVIAILWADKREKCMV